MRRSLIPALLFLILLAMPDAARGQFTTCSAQTAIPAAECDALVALYQNTDGAKWTKRTGWLQAASPCTWYGVTCAGGRVTELGLSANGLKGSIPADIANLGKLVWLVLDTNVLSGTIPTEIGSILTLKGLFLQENDLWGNIPAELGNLANLEWLALNGNSLTGPVPHQLGKLTKLYSLFLHQNQLIGQIPTELGGMTSLLILALHENQLTGGIPAELGSPPDLERLYVHANQLSGHVPREIARPSNLQRVWISDNQLMGTIPLEVAAAGARSVTCSFAGNETSLCLPKTPEYQALGDPICGLALDPACPPLPTFSASVPAGTSGSIGGAHAGVLVSFTDASDTNGTLEVEEFFSRPANNEAIQIEMVMTTLGPMTPYFVSPDRHWDVQSSGLSGYAYEMCLNVSGLPGLYSPDMLVLVRRSSDTNSWKPYDTTRKTVAATSYICATGLTSFSQFGIAYEESALPIELVYFEGFPSAGRIHLRWQTAAESQTAGFEVQRRVDGVFEPIGLVPAAGSSSEGRAYTFDMSPAEPGLHGFRLRQIGLDGHSALSPEVEVWMDPQGTHFLSGPYPNPFRSSAAFTLTVTAPQRVRVDVYDVLGRRVAELADQDMEANQVYRFTFDRPDRADGVYVIRAEGERFIASRTITALR